MSNRISWLLTSPHSTWLCELSFALHAALADAALADAALADEQPRVQMYAARADAALADAALGTGSLGPARLLSCACRCCDCRCRCCACKCCARPKLALGPSSRSAAPDCNATLADAACTWPHAVARVGSLAARRPLLSAGRARCCPQVARVVAARQSLSSLSSPPVAARCRTRCCPPVAVAVVAANH